MTTTVEKLILFIWLYSYRITSIMLLENTDKTLLELFKNFRVFK